MSRDRYFLDRICDQIIAFEDDPPSLKLRRGKRCGVVVQPGNDSYYLEKRQQREAALRMQMQTAGKGSGARRKNAQTRKPDRPRKLSFKEKAELEGMEELILETEAEAGALGAKLNDPEFQAQHYEEIESMAADLQALQARIAQMYERWEELEAIRLGSEAGGE